MADDSIPPGIGVFQGRASDAGMVTGGGQNGSPPTLGTGSAVTGIQLVMNLLLTYIGAGHHAHLHQVCAPQIFRESTMLLNDGERRSQIGESSARLDEGSRTYPGESTLLGLDPHMLIRLAQNQNQHIEGNYENNREIFAYQTNENQAAWVMAQSNRDMGQVRIYSRVLNTYARPHRLAPRLQNEDASQARDRELRLQSSDIDVGRDQDWMRMPRIYDEYGHEPLEQIVEEASLLDDATQLFSVWELGCDMSHDDTVGTFEDWDILASPETSNESWDVVDSEARASFEEVDAIISLGGWDIIDVEAEKM